jgi:hypothetical protein
MIDHNKTGGPAFARAASYSEVRGSDGMTLRDYFAAQALPTLIEMYPTSSDDGVAGLAYRWADAMLAERQKE